MIEAGWGSCGVCGDPASPPGMGPPLRPGCWRHVDAAFLAAFAAAGMTGSCRTSRRRRSCRRPVHPSALEFATTALRPAEVTGKLVIEAGAFNVNGSARQAIEQHRPARYIGTDMRPGPGVDMICDAADLPPLFGGGSAGVVVSTEMLEHAGDWQSAMTGLIGVLAPGGALVITTRSKAPGITRIRVISGGSPSRRWPRSWGPPGWMCCAANLTWKTRACSRKPANHQAGGKPRRGGPPKG